MICTIRLNIKAKKDLKIVPRHIALKLLAWMDDVENSGLEEARKRPGLHDEPLLGKRQGQRSIRLSRAYRAVYTVKKGEIEFVEIAEVNKHEY